MRRRSGLIESMMGLRPRQGNLRLVFKLVSLMRGLPSKYTCLILSTFVNINILYVIMQLILLSGDLCCNSQDAEIEKGPIV